MLGRRAYKSSPTKLLKDTPKNEGTYSLMFPEKVCSFLPLLNYYRPYINLVGANFHQNGPQNAKKTENPVFYSENDFFSLSVFIEFWGLHGSAHPLRAYKRSP